MKRLIPALIIVLASALPVQAKPFSLMEALNLTLERNLSLRKALLKKKQIDEKAEIVLSGVRPQLSLSSKGSTYNLQDSSAASSLGSPTGLSNYATPTGQGGKSPSVLQNSMSISQVLFDGFRTKDELTLVDLEKKSGDWDVFIARQNALNDVTNAYLNALRMEGLLQVSLASERAALGHLAQSLDRQKARMGTRFEVLQAKTQLSKVRGEVSKAKNAAILAKLTLFNAINISPQQAPLQEVRPLRTVGFDLKQSSEAVDNRAELKQLFLKKQVDQKNIELNDRSYLPTVSGVGSYSMQGSGTDRYWMMEVNSQWNLFDGGHTRAKSNQTKLDLAMDEATIEQAEAALGLEIEKSLRDRDEAKERFQIADEGLIFAKESVLLAESRYTAGMGTSIEVIDAQTSLTQAEQDRIGAHYDLQAAELNLAKALGIDLGDYLIGSSKPSI